MTGSVIRKTPKELHEQRARLIASTGLSEEVLRERGEAFQLYPEHQAVWDTVQSIDYLLDGAKAPEDTPIEEQPTLVQVGWYCWRCKGLVAEACRSDNVPTYVPTDWEKDMAAEVERLSEDDEMVDQHTDANAALARIRALHERRAGAGGEGYCDLCANHGDVSWPCKTIAALDGMEPNLRPYQQ